MSTLEGMNEIDKFVELGIEKETTPAKIKVNAKRNSSNNQATELLTLVENQAA
jgi:hypothetical protein